MFSPIKSFITKTKSTLFTFNNEPFSKFSIFLIIILDIFLLITILTGIDSEKNMSPAADIKYPYQCKNHFDAQYQSMVWNSATRGYTYDTFPFSEYNSFYIPTHSEYHSGKKVQTYQDKRMAPLCTELYKKIAVFAQSDEFKKHKELQNNLRNDKRNVLSEIDSIEKRYNTSLFEKISSDEQESDKKIRDRYYSLLEKEKNIDKQIQGIKAVSAYKGYQEYVDFVNQNREIFKKEYDTYAFWQPFIAFLYVLKFTLPLLLLSVLAHRFSTRPASQVSVPNKLIALISSHIIVITLLPIFIDVLCLIFHIIPRRFFEKIIAFLYEYGFIFLGYYFLMFLGIVSIGLVVFLIQRSVARREKARKEMKEKTLYIDAYNQSRCPNCRNRVDYGKNYCGFCREELNRVCSACHKRTPKHIQYCIECGA
ncbi:MAG TPA: zinc ribbon domain-containing protein [Sulfurovum sp.]